MTDSATNNERDDLPRVSVDTFQDLARIKDSFNEAILDALDKKLADRGLLHHKAAFVKHMQHVCIGELRMWLNACSHALSFPTKQ